MKTYGSYLTFWHLQILFSLVFPLDFKLASLTVGWSDFTQTWNATSEFHTFLHTNSKLGTENN